MASALDEQLKALRGGLTTRYYAGIGSRETPEEMIPVIFSIADDLGKRGYVLRSGAAAGADTFFEQAVDSKDHPSDIWVPWRGFGGKHSEVMLPVRKHFDLASLIHPVWNKLKPSVQGLHARNVGQILGMDFDVDHVSACISKTQTPCPQDSWSEFVVCWTKDKAQSHLEVTSRTGGTGTAIKLASNLGIPVFNLADETAKARLKQYIER